LRTINQAKRKWITHLCVGQDQQKKIKDSGEEKPKKKGEALYYFFETPEKKNQPNSEHKGRGVPRSCIQRRLWV